MLYKLILPDTLCYVMPNAFSTGGSWFDGLAAVQLPDVYKRQAFREAVADQVVNSSNAMNCQ